MHDVDVDYVRGSVCNMVVFLAVDTLNELILFPPSALTPQRLAECKQHSYQASGSITHLKHMKN